MEFTITEQDKLYAENNGGIDQNRILDLFKTSICGEHFTDEAKINIFIHFHMISQNRIVYVPSADFNNYLWRVYHFGKTIADRQVVAQRSITMEDEYDTEEYESFLGLKSFFSRIFKILFANFSRKLPRRASLDLFEGRIAPGWI